MPGLRIGIGQLWQETNTFNPLATTQADFEQFGVLRGQALLEQLADTNEIGGFLAALREWRIPHQSVGLVRLAAWPSGRATGDTFAWLAEEILAAIRQAFPLDGLFLALHGALAAEDHPDVEGEILQQVRNLVGLPVPIVATLDLHAHVTPAMVAAADALVLYHTAPHIDVWETGKRAGHLLGRILEQGAAPRLVAQSLPMAPPAELANTQAAGTPRANLKERLQAVEAQPGILSAGVATVQPWLDVPGLSSTVVVVTDGDAGLAEATCRSFAAELWDSRDSYLPELVDFTKAVREARDCRDGLVVISDAADATTSGAPGDSTWLLTELLKYRWRRPALVTLVAPELIADLIAVGVGGKYAGPVGGRRDTRFSRPVAVDACVERIFDARFSLSGHIGRNLPIDMGRGVLLRQQQVHLVLTEKSGPHFAPELFQAAGLDPFSAAVLIAKSPCGFRAAYEQRAQRILVAQAPGCAPPDFWNCEYRHRPVPTWPWERSMTWDAAQAPLITVRQSAP